MSNTFDWIEIRTKNMEKTVTFYETLFGWKIVRKETTEGSDYWIFDTGDEPRMENIRRGAIWLRPGDEHPGVVVYIVVEDIKTILTKVKELGGNVVAPRTLQGSAFRTYFTDPDGNMLGLWEEKKVD